MRAPLANHREINLPHCGTRASKYPQQVRSLERSGDTASPNCAKDIEISSNSTPTLPQTTTVSSFILTLTLTPFYS